jgi:tagatose 1,6-diphosphate aldolase
MPWALLSGGAPWTVFLRQAEIACASGASGVIAGRAFWKEAVTADRGARNGFLAGEATERFCRLRAICDASARPFQHLLQPVDYSTAIS